LGENIFNCGILRFDFVENPGMAFGLSFGGLTSKYILGVFRVFAVFFIGKYIYLLIKTKNNGIF
jgi:signal peptidase II